MIGQLENSLRIKVTGRCNRKCFFCHEEGGMGSVCDIFYSDDLKKIINIAYQEFGMQSIALTGGEPLLLDGLTDFVKSISENTKIHRFTLTTNGTIEKDIDFWYSLKQSGLYKVNVSMPDILDRIPVSNDKTSKLKIFQNQLLILKNLSSLGVSANINIVVYNDWKYLSNILNALLNSEISHEQICIALLPDLTNNETFNNSQVVIRDIITALNCKKTMSSRRRGTSNVVCDYITPDGYKIQVKTTKPNGTPQWLQTLCSTCDRKKDCQEGFYGLRLEKRDGVLFIRMCLYRSDEEVLMNINDFIHSPVFSELKALWGKTS